MTLAVAAWPLPPPPPRGGEKKGCTVCLARDPG